MIRPLTGSLRVKLIAWFFVPTAIILVAVALVNFNSFQNVTEDLVIERDRDLTQLWAGQLATNFDKFPKVLGDVSHLLGISRQSTAEVQASLTGASPELRIFDGGVVVLDTFGIVTAAHPFRPEIVGQDWSDRDHFRQMLRFPGPVFSDVLSDGSMETEVIEVAVPITGDQSQFLGSIVGVFDLRATSISAFYSGILRLRIGNGNSFIVDGNGTVIYHDDRGQVGADFGAQQPVIQVLLGNVGAIRNRNQQDTDQVAAFAPIPGTPWGLVTEESWSSLTSGSRNTQRYLLLLLALGVIVPAIVVAIGLKRVMRPIKALTQGAQRIAAGDFDYSIGANSGDEIQELAQQFNMMADALKESYAGLEQRVEARTEELREANETLKAFIEASPLAIGVLDRDRKLRLWNKAGEGMFGWTEAEALAQPHPLLSGVEHRDESLARQRRILEGESLLGLELRLQRKDGSPIDVEVWAAALRDTKGEISGGIVIYADITERKAAQEALRQAEEKYRRIFDDSKDPILLTSGSGRILDANQAAFDLFGYSAEELMELTFPEMCEDPAANDRFVAEVNSEGSVKDYEIRLIKKDGSVADCVVSVTVQRDDYHRIVAYHGMIRDITESKLADEDALRQTREVAVLEERNRMAREIHDTMAQGFTGIVLQMEAAEQSMETSPAALPEHLNRARALAREGLQEARRSVWGLMPHALERLTLDSALEEEVRRFDAEGRSKIAFTKSGKRRELTPAVQTVLLRICQESLTNIRRHAEASQVEVILDYRDHEVMLSVQDNGAGFDLATVEAEKSGVSFGLIGMRQRAQQINGQLTIDSTKNQGTSVRLTIPTP